MKVSNLLAAAGAVLALSAGAALAAEACECCKDMVADAEMSCCDKTQGEPEPAPPTPAPDQGQPEARRPPP